MCKGTVPRFSKWHFQRRQGHWTERQTMRLSVSSVGKGLMSLHCSCHPAFPSKCGGSACMHAKSLQSCPTLCDPMDCSPPGSSVHGILQARILEWVAMPSSMDLPDRGMEPVSHYVSCIGRQVLYHWQGPNQKTGFRVFNPRDQNWNCVLFEDLVKTCFS